jgi:hypothetical protein
MKVMHTTIQRSQKILQCLEIRWVLNISDILLIYRNYAQVMSVDNSLEVVFSGIATYPLDVSVCWCSKIGEGRIAVVTREAQLVMLKRAPPFERVSCHQMSDRMAPSRIPIAFFARSMRDEFLVCCAFREVVVVIQFDSVERPSLQTMSLPNFTVLGVASTQEPSYFDFLVASDGGNRYLITFDVDRKREVNRRRMPSSADRVISIFDIVGYSKTIVFTGNGLNIYDTEGSGITIELSSRVHSWFMTGDGDLVVQFANGSIYTIPFRNPSELSAPETWPLISNFCLLGNRLLQCITDSGEIFFVLYPTGLSFDLLSPIKIDIPPTPGITSALFRDRFLYICSAGGENCEYAISAYQNTMYFSMDIDPSLTEAFENSGLSDTPVRLFALPDDTVIASSDRETITLSGNISVRSRETLAVGEFGSGFAHVHRLGIQELISGREFSTDDSNPLKLGSVCDRFIVATFSDGIVRLFDWDLSIAAEQRIPSVHCVTFCGDGLAIAAQPAGGGNPTVTIYSMDLMPSDHVGQLTSPAYSLLYVPGTLELFISTANGAVSRWLLGADFSRSCTQIFVSDRPALLLGLSDAVLIASTNVHVFSERQLLVLGVEAKSICSGHGPGELFAIDLKNRVCRITGIDARRDFVPTTNPARISSNPRKLANFGKSICAISRSRSDNVFNSWLFELRTDGNEPLITQKAHFPSDVGPVSLLSVGEFLFVGCATLKSDGVLSVLRRGDQSYEQIDSFQLQSPPIALTALGDGVAVGVGPFVKCLSLQEGKWTFGEANFGPVPTGVGFLEAREGFLWVGDRTQGVFCFSLRDNDRQEREAQDRERPVAVDPEPRQMTAMCAIDMQTVAVGDRSGVICLLRLPKDVLKPNVQWRVSSVPDRGLAQPYAKFSGRLIRVAAFSVDEAVTSILRSPRNNTVFYTTLLGQVGAFVRVEDEVEFNALSAAEAMTLRKCQGEFGLTILRKREREKLNAVSADILDYLEQLQPTSQRELECYFKIPKQSLVGLVCRLKYQAKF